MKDDYPRSIMSLNRLNNSLLDCFAIIGFDEDTGLKPEKQQVISDLYNTAFKPQVTAILTWDGTLYPTSDLCKETNLLPTNVTFSQQKKLIRKHRENSLKARESFVHNEDLQNILPFCFPDSAYAYESQLTEKIHFLVLTNIMGFYSYVACFTYYKQFIVETQQNEFTGYRIHPSSTIKDRSRENRTICYLPICCVFISKFPYYNTMKNCLAWAAREINRYPEKMILILEDLAHQLYLVPVPPPGPVTIKYHLHSLLLTIKAPESPDRPLIDFSLGIILACFSIKEVLKIFNCILAQQKIVFLSSSYALLTLIMEGFRSLIFPFKWPYVYVPILSTSLLDYLEAPGSYMMGVQMSLKDRVEEIPGLVIITIDECNVSYSSGVYVPPLPEFAQLQAEIALSKIKVEEKVDLSDRLLPLSDEEKYSCPYQYDNVNQQIQQAFLGLMMNLFADVNAHLNLHTQLFDKEKFLLSRSPQDRELYKEIFKGQVFNTYLRELTDQKIDIRKLYLDSQCAEGHKTMIRDDISTELYSQEVHPQPKRTKVTRRNAFKIMNLKRPVITNSLLTLKESKDTNILILPMFHKSGEQLYMSRCISLLNQALQDNKLSSLKAVHLYLRGMFYIANNQPVKGLEDFHILTAHDIRLFPADIIGGILVSLPPKDSSLIRKKSLFRATEVWRKLVDRTSIIIENNIIGPENMPTRPLDFQMFTRYLQRLCVAYDQELIKKLFSVLTEDKKEYVNAEVFEVFYNSWKEIRQDCHLMEKQYPHLEEDEMFLKVSSEIKCDYGMGRLILTDKRILFLLSGLLNFQEVIRFRNIKTLEKFRIVKLPSVVNALRITSTVNGNKIFVASLRKERKLWCLMIKEMCAGKNLSEHNRDTDFITQATKHVQLLAALAKCIQAGSIKLSLPIKKIAKILCKFTNEVEQSDSKEEEEEHPYNLIQKLNPNQKEPETYTVETILYVPGNYDDERIPPRLWCALGNGKVKAFNAQSWTCETCYIQAKNRVSCLIAVGCQEIWAGSFDTSIYIIDSESITSNKQLILHSDFIIDLAYNSEHGFVYSVSVNGHIIKWNIESRQRIDQHKFNDEELNVLSLKYIDRKLWCCARQKLVILNERFHVIRELKSESGPYFKNFLLTSSEQIWICCKGGVLSVWNAETFTKVKDIRTYTSSDFVQLVSLKNQVWAGTTTGKIVIFDTESKEYMKTLQAHDDTVRSMISLDNKTVISGSGSKEGRIAMWRFLDEE